MAVHSSFFKIKHQKLNFSIHLSKRQISHCDFKKKKNGILAITC